MTSVLLVAHERLGPLLTGPTIRSWELAAVLSETCRVTLAGPGPPEREHPGFATVSYDGRMAELVHGHDVVVAFGYLLEKHPELADSRHLVVDLYDPFPLENLHMHKAETLPDQQRTAAHDRAVQNRLLAAGDMFLCASERQRDFWTGWLAAAGRVNPYVHRVDAGLKALLRVVPFGIPDQPPRPGPRRYRGVVAGIDEDDVLLLWGGGLWNWFDPLTLIRAVDRVKQRAGRLRVVFPAATNPGSESGPMWMPEAARRLSDDLGLTGRQIFFGSGWVPYEEHGHLLLECDVGLSLHLEDVETRYSFRTRVLDYLWAGLPILTTEGDTLADLIRAEDLGEVVPYGDVTGVAGALLRLTEPDRLAGCAKRSLGVSRRFHWRRVAEPLVAYCREPRPAPDSGLRGTAESKPERRVPRLVRRARETLREEGPAGLGRRGFGYLRRHLSG